MRRQVTRINHPAAQAFVLTSATGRELLRIDLATGEVTAAIETANEAARAFVGALRTMTGQRDNARYIDAVDALKALIAGRPENWDDEVDDPEAYRAWRDAEHVLRRMGELS